MNSGVIPEACAILSQILAERLKQKKSAVQFTTTLLDDAVKLSLADLSKTILKKSIGWSKEKNLCFLEAEREALGIDHAELGGRLPRAGNSPGTS